MKTLNISVIRLNSDSDPHQPTAQGGSKRRQFAAALIANLVSIAYGAVNGWPSPSLLLLRNKETSVGGEPVTAEEESWLSSVSYLGALISAPVFSYICQEYGRKAAGYLTALPLIIGWLFIIFADSIILVLVARIFMGLHIGGVNVFITLYCGEIAEDSIRGALGTFRSLLANFGIIYIYGLAPLVSIQTMGMISVTIPILFLFAYFWLPESPLFLMVKGKEEEAMKSLLWLRGGNKEAAKVEMEKLTLVVREFTSYRSKKVTLRDILSNRGTRRALSITLILAVIQQLSGMYVVINYCASIFEMSGSDLSPHMSSLIVSCVLLSGSAFSSFVSDLAGRRFVLISTQILLTISLGTLGTYFYLKEIGIDVSIVGVLPIICISVYLFALVAGLATLAYVIMSETFNPEARGIAMTSTNTVIWLLAFLITKFYPALVNVLQSYGCFWLFAGVALLGTIYTYFQLPETKNRSLESILRELNGDSS